MTATGHARWVAATLLVAILGSACAGEGSDEGVDLENVEDSADSEDTTTTEPEEEAGEPTKEEVAAALGGDSTGGVSDDDAMCVGLAMVDAVGLDVLLDTGAFEQMDEGSANSLADLGITLDESQKAALIDGLHGCGDLRTMLQEEMSSDGSIPPEGAACMTDGLDDATIDRLFVTTITGGEAALNADTELLDAITQATLDCIAAGVDVGE